MENLYFVVYWMIKVKFLSIFINIPDIIVALLHSARKFGRIERAVA